jgi:hypothetical protein
MQKFHVYYVAKFHNGDRITEMREIESQSYITAHGVAQHIMPTVQKEIENRGISVKSLKFDDAYLDKK